MLERTEDIDQSRVDRPRSSEEIRNDIQSEKQII